MRVEKGGEAGKTPPTKGCAANGQIATRQATDEYAPPPTHPPTHPSQQRFWLLPERRVSSSHEPLSLKRGISGIMFITAGGNYNSATGGPVGIRGRRGRLAYPELLKRRTDSEYTIVYTASILVGACVLMSARPGKDHPHRKNACVLQSSSCYVPVSLLQQLLCCQHRACMRPPCPRRRMPCPRSSYPK